MQILQRFSVTLSSVIIAIFVCNCLYFSSLKLQQISLITKFIDTYNSSNSRYFSNLVNPFYTKSETLKQSISLSFRGKDRIRTYEPL